MNITASDQVYSGSMCLCLDPIVKCVEQSHGNYSR